MPTTKYLWDDDTDTVMMEKDGSGVTQAVYNTDPVPYGRLFSMRRGGKTYNYRYDGQGSTCALTDETGQITDTYKYDAWGNERAHTGTTINPYRFIGQQGYQYNEETQDYYVRERPYEPKDARWKSKDPLGFVDGLNAYVYAGNGPVSVTDPSGWYELSDAAKAYCTEKCKGQGVVLYAACYAKCLVSINQNKLPNRQQLFDAWYKLEKADMLRSKWTDKLPKCPCCDRAIPCVCDAPDPEVWTKPKPVEGIPLNKKTFAPLQKQFGFKPVVVSLHPGAVTEIRTKKKYGGAGNQCTYDKNHRLITGGDGAGTADRKWFGGIWGAVLKGGHIAEDLTPALIAYYLDGLSFGANMKKYLEVRPSLNDPDCDENIVPAAKPAPKKKAKSP